jgi:two-component system, OmpR family, KDP operon response regulator KdpE
MPKLCAASHAAEPYVWTKTAAGIFTKVARAKQALESQVANEMIIRLPVAEGSAASQDTRPVNSVLVIDDEPQIRRFVRAGLEQLGYTVELAETGGTGLSAAAQMKPDVIVLDLGLPDMSGTEVLESVRAWSNVPVIVLSIESAEEQKVLHLKLGADDYIVKPFGIAELAARCGAAMRRAHKSADENPFVRTGPLVVDLITRSAMFDRKQIALSITEFRLLRILALHLGLVVTHQQLIKEVWGTESRENIHYLRTLMRLLRQKIEPDPHQPRFLIAESGVGYRLERHDRPPSS